MSVLLLAFNKHTSIMLQNYGRNKFYDTDPRWLMPIVCDGLDSTSVYSTAGINRFLRGKAWRYLKIPSAARPGVCLIKLFITEL
jgi:hypothetical protein